MISLEGDDGPESDALRRARAVLEEAGRVVVLTGAGVSAESGVPTFRGPGGLWRSFRPEELATPEAFARDPVLVWEWYTWRRGLVAACVPNAGHDALAHFALRRPGRVTIVTQNVDGLHDRAAYAVDPDRPGPALALEVHGQLARDRCSGCAIRTPGSADLETTTKDHLPRCLTCGALLRPDVVWFGESLDASVIGGAFEAAEQADVCLVVGTSALVHPAASIPSATAASGGVIIEVNLERTPLSASSTQSLVGAAGDILPALLNA